MKSPKLPISSPYPAPSLTLRLQEALPQALIDAEHPDTQDNLHGFEGGTVITIGDELHLFTTELFEIPFLVKTRLATGEIIALFDGANERSIAYATSTDGRQWSRQALLEIPKEAAAWIGKLRTPLGLIPIGDPLLHGLYPSRNATQS